MSLGRLPVEILQEIFSRAADRIKLHTYRPHRAGSQSPWHLALVCKTWRDVVLSTPCLWSDISLKLIPRAWHAFHEPETLLSTWKLCLARSLNHPLTIKFDCEAGDGEVTIQILPFMKALVGDAQRWETVILCIPMDYLLSFLSDYPIQYSCLRRLCLDNSARREPKKDAVGLFRDAPLLSCIHLVHLPYGGQYLGGAGIPWSQISHLKIYQHFGGSGDLMDVLVHTPNLVTLDYSVMYGYLGIGGPLQLELPHLQRINWNGEDEEPYDSQTSDFFSRLKAPQLSVLRVYVSYVDRALGAIQGCLQRSKCSLAYLDIPTFRVHSLLCLTPHVKTLVFGNHPGLYNDNSTTYDSSRDQLELAHLQKLVLRCEIGETSPILGFLKAPQLSILEVFGPCSDIGLGAIQDFLRKSRCSLASLALRNPRLSSLLRYTASVETLVLPSSDNVVLISILKDLTFDHSASSWLLPKLRKIVLDFDIAAGPLFNAFIAMLKSRLLVPPSSLVRLRCHRLKELELRGAVSKHMSQWVQKRLTPQEPLVITHKGWSFGGEWHFVNQKYLD